MTTMKSGDTSHRGDVKYLYLNLLKNSLSFSLWPEPPVPIEAFQERRWKGTRFVVNTVSRGLHALGLALVRSVEFTGAQREDGRIWPAYAHTMVGRRRLDNLQECIETVLRDDVKGDLIETGVWRGGSCILMRGVLAAHGVLDRRVFV